jgi:truncated hemoglobin YjbI
LTIAVLDLVVLIAILGAVIYYGQRLDAKGERHLQEARLTRELLQKLADDTLELEHADRPIGHQALEAIRRLESPPVESTQPVVAVQRPCAINLLDGDPSEVIAPPPVVGGHTVRDLLVHYTFGQVTWPQVVGEFYDDAAQDPEIADYFHGVELEDLKRHFTAVISLVNKNGLTRGNLKAMAEKHRDVRNVDGRPITGEVYDNVIKVLANVLLRHSIPLHAVNALGNTVKPLRDVIVVAG